MPPKNKKQLEEEAKRLEEEQRKKQEQERKLQQQRRKYASQVLNTDLVLPVSMQLISDFIDHPSAFISQKLNDVLVLLYPDLKDSKLLKQLIKQLLHTIKNSMNLFHQNANLKIQNNEEINLKIRIICGLYLQIFLNQHPLINKQSRKTKASDQNTLKKLLIAHSQNKNEKQRKVFDKNEVLEVLKYFKQNYFNHYLVLHKFSSFPKRQDHKSFTIFIASPAVQFNTLNTTFIDLSNRNPNSSNQNEDKKSDVNTD